MKICITAMTGIYPIDLGGPGSVAYFLSKELGRLKDEITLLIRAKTKEQLVNIENTDELQELKNVKILPIQLSPGWKTLLNFPNLLSKTHQTIKHLNSEEFDIIHYNSPPVDLTLIFPRHVLPFTVHAPWS